MGKGVRACLFEMLNEGVMTDVTFVVQGIKIEGHRTVIGSRKGLLRDLLKSKNSHFEVSDVSPQTFRSVLRYLYTDKCHVNHQNIFQLMYAAKKFNLKELGDHCAKADLLKITETDVGLHTAQALYFDAAQYLKMCTEYFRTNTSKVINAEEFLKIPYEVLVEFCSTENIMCPVLDLYAACFRWAKHECKSRNLLDTSENLVGVAGDALRKIKLSKISMEDFLQFIVPLDVLSYEEVGRVVVGIQAEEKRLNLPKYWSESARVTVLDYRKNHRDHSELYLPMTTKISELKKMKIFEGGQVAYPPDKFTLRCYKYSFGILGLKEYFTELEDRDALASLGSVDIILEINTISITVNVKGDLVYPLTVQTKDLWKKDEDIIINFVCGEKEIHPDKIAKFNFSQKIPGGTAIIVLK